MLYSKAEQFVKELSKVRFDGKGKKEKIEVHLKEFCRLLHIPEKRINWVEDLSFYVDSKSDKELMLLKSMMQVGDKRIKVYMDTLAVRVNIGGSSSYVMVSDTMGTQDTYFLEDIRKEDVYAFYRMIGRYSQSDWIRSYWLILEHIGAYNEYLKLQKKELYAKELYDFYKVVKPLFKALKSGLFAFQFTIDSIVCCLNPRIEHEDNELHSDSISAIEWESGDEKYYLRDIEFSESLWKTVCKPTFSIQALFEIENIEQRMAALKYKGNEWLLEKSKAKLLHKSNRGNELYLIENIFTQPAYFLKYQDTSTDRVYVSGVDPDIGRELDADKAMAWKFKVEPYEYKSLENEA